MLLAVQARPTLRPSSSAPLSRERFVPQARHRAVTRRLVALIALVISVFFALPASAGTLHVSDDAGVFSAGQLSTLRRQVDGYDFDVRLVTTSSYTSKSDLGGYVHRFVTEPNIVVIGLDPQHHHVSVHFGTGTGIPDSAFKPIESAGIPSFKDADWTGGVTAILDRAEKSVEHRGGASSGPVRTVSPGAVSSGPSHGAGGLFWLVVLGGGLVFLIWLIARRRSPGVPPAAGYGPPGGGGGPPMGGYGGYGPPAGGYGAPPAGSGSGLGAGLVGAGVGGLIGYELGKEVAEHHHRRDDYGPPPGEWVEERGGPGPDYDDRSATDEPGNYDAGGASGGWDDSGGGGSDDSGGGGGNDADF
jgi:hypothetical protein